MATEICMSVGRPLFFRKKNFGTSYK